MPISICMLISRLDYRGGMEQQAAQLGTALKNKGVDVWYLTQGVPIKEKVNPFLPNCKIIRIPAFLSPESHLGAMLYAFLVPLILFYHRKKFQILHAHELSINGVMAGFCGKLLRKPVITKVACATQYGDLGYLKNSSFFLWRKKQIFKINKIIALTGQIETELVDFGVPHNHIARIPNGVDTNLFSPCPNEERKRELRRTLNLPETAPIGLYIGRFAQQKNLEFLISIWELVVQKLSQSILILVGSGPLEKELKEKAQPMIQNHQIIFYPSTSRVVDYYQASDLFLLTSHSEGMSNVILEAMACGLPCLVSDIPANREVVENELSESLCPIHEPQLMAQRILHLFSNPEEYNKLGHIARRKIETDYAFSKIAEQYLRIYNGLIKDKK